ncbi:MAG: hypothetical protein Q7R50_01345 [Dehalococcoidales bacterium]|nr:hypothetical protein [Dehalococcoidales bacterium]
MPFESGPYLKTACFCEKVLREADGVLSIIRIVDRVTVTAQGPNAPELMPKTPYTVTALITLVSGSSKGRHELKMIREDPSGLKKDPAFVASVHMEGANKSQNIVISMNLNLEEEGLIWFHVYLGKDLLTKMPFEVIYARISAGIMPPGETPG